MAERVDVATTGGIRAIIFDLGRVLVDVDTTRGLFGDLTGRADGEATVQALMDDGLIRQYNTGRIDPATFHAELCARLGLTIDFDAFRARWCDVFEPIPEMLALLAQLRRRWPVGLLSDTDPLHWEHIRRVYPVAENLQHITLSYQVGASKPDPAIYRAAAAGLGVPCTACFYVDDLLRNVEGARAVGMDAVQFRGVEPLREELAARGLWSAAEA